jgi:hypothetical protein
MSGSCAALVSIWLGEGIWIWGRVAPGSLKFWITLAYELEQFAEGLRDRLTAIESKEARSSRIVGAGE